MLSPFPLNAIGLECLRVKSGESLVQVSWRFHSMNDHTETWGNGWVWRIKKCHHRQRKGGELSLILIISVSSGRFDGDLFDIYRRKLESTTSPKIRHYSPHFCVSFISHPLLSLSIFFFLGYGKANLTFSLAPFFSLSLGSQILRHW